MTQRRILTVDDDPVNLEIMTRILRDYDVETAECGEAALERAEVLRPDLVLLDIMMPGIDGYEVCRRLRNYPELRNTKVVLVSAKAMTEERLAGYEAGADDYITKPFDSDELLAKVRVFLRLLSAEEMDKLKGELLNLVSHEIRTPLTGIIPGGEVLAAEGPMDIEQRRMWGEMILANGKRLLALAEKGMLLCQLRSGSYELQREPTDVLEFVRDTANEVDDSANRRFILLAEEADYTATIDRKLCAQVIQGMLENAMRFGPEGSPIEISVEREQGQIRFSVTDHGPGIEKEVLSGVFQVFTKRVVDSTPVGAGVTMSLARAILRAHGGEVDVESFPGHRTTFYGWLPALHPAPVDAPKPAP